MTESSPRDRLRANWQRVVDEVREAARKHARSADSIRIIGVSKYVDVDMTRLLIDAGCLDLGESRPQQLWQKADELQEVKSIRWHLIGHLQRNKIRRTLRVRPLLHSVDSARLLHAIGKEADSQEQLIDVLLEVNVSGDEAKTGFSPPQVAAALNDLPPSGVRVLGLMAMAGWGTERRQARQQFAQLRELRDRLVNETGNALPELSMGMSGDFVEAIAEGASMVRIGSRLFDGLIET